MVPSLPAAIALGLRAVRREPWLLAVGLLVALLRRAAAWPAIAVAWAILVRGSLLALSRHPLSPAAPIEAALATVRSPRFVALVAGLWLAGAVLGAALRVAYVAGALPTLGGALAGAPGPRFASGAVHGFPRVLAASALGLVLEVSAGIFGGTLALAAARISLAAGARGGSALLAAAVAAALVLAAAVPAALSVVADAAVARAALRGDGPGRAFAESGARFLSRPGTFLLAAVVFGALGLAGPGLAAGAGSLATGFAAAVSPVVLAGPQLMVAAAAAAVAAGIDLVWLGTAAALACAGDAPAGA
jgi:hypothetical protein